MSRKIWGICLCVFAVCILAAVFSSWYLGRNTPVPPEEQQGTKLVEAAPARAAAEGVAASRNSVQEEALEEDTGQKAEPAKEAYQFILTEHDARVAVYRLPENEIYEYTDVALDILPAVLQEEIRGGKYLRNEEELYNFLENYTS